MKKPIHVSYTKNSIILQEFKEDPLATHLLPHRKVYYNKFLLAGFFRNFIINSALSYVYTYVYYMIFYIIQSAFFVIPNFKQSKAMAIIKKNLNKAEERLTKAFKVVNLKFLSEGLPYDYFINSSFNVLEKYVKEEKESLPHPFEMELEPIPRFYKTYTEKIIRVFINSSIKEISKITGTSKIKYDYLKSLEGMFTKIINEILFSIFNSKNLIHMNSKLAVLPNTLNARVLKAIKNPKFLDKIIEIQVKFIFSLFYDLLIRSGNLKMNKLDKESREYIKSIIKEFSEYLEKYEVKLMKVSLKEDLVKVYYRFMKSLSNKFPTLFKIFISYHYKILSKLIKIVEDYQRINNLLKSKKVLMKKLPMTVISYLITLSRFSKAKEKGKIFYDDVMNESFIKDFVSAILTKMARIMKYEFESVAGSDIIFKIIQDFISIKVSEIEKADSPVLQAKKIKLLILLFNDPILTSKASFNNYLRDLASLTDKKSSNVNNTMNKGQNKSSGKKVSSKNKEMSSSKDTSNMSKDEGESSKEKLSDKKGKESSATEKTIESTSELTGMKEYF